MPILQSFDALGFNFFNHQIATPWLDYLMVVITELGNGWASGIVTLFLLRHTFIKENKISYIGAFSGLAVGSLVCASLKYGLARPRPATADFLGEPVRLVNELLTKNSLPSGHTFTIFAITSILAYFRPQLAIPAYIVALLVAISRIYLAAHFPTDVISGAFLGCVSIYLGIFAAKKIAAKLIKPKS